MPRVRQGAPIVEGFGQALRHRWPRSSSPGEDVGAGVGARRDFQSRLEPFRRDTLPARSDPDVARRLAAILAGMSRSSWRRVCAASGKPHTRMPAPAKTATVYPEAFAPFIFRWAT